MTIGLIERTMEKQIEEMRKDVASIHRFFLEDDDYEILDDYIADMLFEKGYRKASDVAREIFAEIEEEIKLALESNYKAHSERMKKPIVDMADEFIGWVEGKITALRGIENFIAELKKKYESEGGECLSES